MKLSITSCTLFSSLITVFLNFTSFAQPVQGGGSSGVVCQINDSFKTNKIWLTSGIDYRVSESTRLPSAYGGNTTYTTVNHNVDPFWIVTKLSATYNPRSSSPLAYTGTYLNLGDNPYLLSTAGNYLQGYWSIRDAAGNCNPPSTTNNGFNGWLSVYTEGGGQTVNAFDDINDGFRFDRCFALCDNDSLTFDLKLLADDIVDSVMVDDQHLYIVPSSVAGTLQEFACSNELTIHKTIAVAAGRHFFRVWARDIFHGHIGLNVFGSVTATNNYLVKTKYDERCTLAYPSHTVVSEVPEVTGNFSDASVFPNPGKETFSITTHEKCLLEVFDAYGKKRLEQSITRGTSNFSIGNSTAGVYFVRLSYGTRVEHVRVVVE